MVFSEQDRMFRAVMQDSARHIRVHWWQCFSHITQSRRAMVKRMHQKAILNSKTLGVQNAKTP
jgi:hypothetical protein